MNFFFALNELYAVDKIYFFCFSVATPINSNIVSFLLSFSDASISTNLNVAKKKLNAECNFNKKLCEQRKS